MPKSFDIKPIMKNKPQAVTPVAASPSEPKIDTIQPRRKTGTILVLLFTLIVAAVVIFELTKNNTTSADTVAPVTNEVGQPERIEADVLGNTDMNGLINIKIYNASGISGNGAKAADLLKQYNVIQTVDASNEYEQTVIYYTEGNYEKAKSVGEILESSYQVKLQLTSSLDDGIDVLVIIGKL